jgi:hypothetical protein
MRGMHDMARSLDLRHENFAAELTTAIYPFILRRTPKALWLKMELGLWRALAEIVKKWVRRQPPAVSPQQLEAWREGFLVELTDSAFHIALNNGIKGSLLELELCIYQAIRLVTRKHSRISTLKVRPS